MVLSLDHSDGATFDHSDGATFAIYCREFRAVLGTGFERPILIEDAHEGPVYVAAEHALYFTTVPEPGPKNIAINRLQLAGQESPFETRALDTVQLPFNMANGMTLDREGRLVICEQGTRGTPARISQMGLKTRAFETVVDQWRGLRFNSPNDVVVKSDSHRVVHRSALRRHPRLQGCARGRRVRLSFTTLPRARRR
jgi:gluconolactonase